MISTGNEDDSKTLNKDLLAGASFKKSPAYKDFLLRCARLGIPAEDAAKMLPVK